MWKRMLGRRAPRRRGVILWAHGRSATDVRGTLKDSAFRYCNGIKEGFNTQHREGRDLTRKNLERCARRNEMLTHVKPSHLSGKNKPDNLNTPEKLMRAARARLRGHRRRVKAKRPPSRDSVKAKPSTRDGRGGGGGAPVVPLDDDVRLALDALDEAGRRHRCASARARRGPATLRDVGARRAGDVVVLKDAFRDEFAQAVHAELAADTVDWALSEACRRGYHHRHHTRTTRAWSARLRRALGVFADERTRAFIGELAGAARARDEARQAGTRRATAAPHRLVGQRTVAYVWHLSKGWRPEWGSALYWAAPTTLVAASASSTRSCSSA
ncbi:hypothetical protein JL720_13238 [Aureococcus anophagefferens]|nr:hypothetical protein JL720_13238 [Aureococcus anophagefferens]